MSGILDSLLEQYGQRVTVCTAGRETACRAFLQPIRERVRQKLPTPLGRARQDQWLYLGGPAVPLDGPPGGTVAWNGLRFDVRTAQPIYVGDRLSHWWAVLTVRDPEPETGPDGGPDTDGGGAGT